MFANHSSGERQPTSAFGDATITLPAEFAGESADSSPVGLWSELGLSRWSNRASARGLFGDGLCLESRVRRNRWPTRRQGNLTARRLL
jgi:hypothetical protein